MTKKQTAAKIVKHPEYLIAGALLVLFLTTRLYNILGIPMFNDEAIYIRWAQIFSQQPMHPFLSLSDGKQPLFIWMMAVPLRIMSDPLLASRLISVITGFVGMVGMFMLTREIFKDKLVAVAAALMYVIYPYSLMYDRMALYDSTVAMFAIWALYMQVILVRRRTYRTAIVTGLVIGGGLLTKSSAFFSLFLIPFSLLLFPFKSKKTKEILADENFRQWLRCIAIAVIGAYALYSLLRISPNFRYIASKNGEFTLTIGEWMQHPFSQLSGSIPLLWNFILGYSTWPFLLLIPLAFVIEKRYLREKLLLLSWCILPLIAFALFAKLLYPRYILFMLMPLLPLTALSIVGIFRRLHNKYVATLLVGIMLLPMLVLDYKIVTDFARSNAPERDRYAYAEGFYSGVGVKHVAEILTQKSKDQTIYVATHGGFGIMPQGLQNYLYKNPNIIIESFAGIGPQPPAQVVDASRKYPTYHVFSAPCPDCPAIGKAPKTWNVREIYRYKRLEDNSYLTLVQVLPPNDLNTGQ